MAEINQQILISRFEAVKAQIRASLLYNGMSYGDYLASASRDLYKILMEENLKEELGPYYIEIFTNQFAYGVHTFFKKRESILTFAIESRHQELSSFVVNTMIDLKLMSPDLAIEHVVEALKNGRHDSAVMKLLDYVPVETLKEFESSTKSSLLRQARRNEMQQTVQAIETKLDYQPPAETKDITQTKKLSFSDPREMVRSAINSQSSGMALDVGSDILHTCARFFDEVQKRSAAGFKNGIEAGQRLQELATKAQEARASLAKISNDLDKLRIPPGILGQLTLTVRSIMPILDPHKQLDHDFGDAITATKTSYDLSKSVVKAYEDFSKHYPDISSEIDNLVAALNEGIEEIDAKADLTPDLAQLKTVFLGIVANAQTMSAITAQNAAAVDMMKTTEIQFALSILNVQTAFSAISTDMSLSLAYMKANTTPEIQKLAGEEIRDHMARAESRLAEFKTLVEQRQEAVRAILPSPRARALEAA